jgi:hypothetical protein
MPLGGRGPTVIVRELWVELHLRRDETELALELALELGRAPAGGAVYGGGWLGVFGSALMRTLVRRHEQ